MSLRNIYGGNKAKSKKRCRTKQQYVDTLDDEGLQMYGQMIECKGGLHFKILGSDNKYYLGRLSNKMKKGKRLTNGMYVVISLREFESDKKTCDIIALANPPSNIIEQFKINNPTKYNDIIFCDSDYFIHFIYFKIIDMSSNHKVIVVIQNSLYLFSTRIYTYIYLFYNGVNFQLELERAHCVSCIAKYLFFKDI